MGLFVGHPLGYGEVTGMQRVPGDDSNGEHHWSALGEAVTHSVVSCRMAHMDMKALLGATRGSRRASSLGDFLAKEKLDAARRLTPEQRLRVALDLSDAAHLLHRACSK